MKYPRINKEELTAREKKLFNLWYKKFISNIKITGDSRNIELSKKDIEVLAYNCSFEVVSKEHIELRDVGKCKNKL
jgi:hypothetical protein